MRSVLDRRGPFTLCVLDRGGAYDRHVVLLTELWCFRQRGSTLNPLRKRIDANYRGPKTVYMWLYLP